MAGIECTVSITDNIEVAYLKTLTKQDVVLFHKVSNIGLKPRSKNNGHKNKRANL